jgi:hypothetical protein
MKTIIFLILIFIPFQISGQTWDEIPAEKAIEKLSEEELIKRVRKYRPADLCDALDAMGVINRGTMSHQMRPNRPGIGFAGFAYTVKFVPTNRSVIKCSSPDGYF